jgi:hypothetical protein
MKKKTFVYGWENSLTTNTKAEQSLAASVFTFRGKFKGKLAGFGSTYKTSMT